MSSRRRGFESGFIGETKARMNDSGYDEVYAGEGGDNPTGFAGMHSARRNDHATGFEGLASDRRRGSSDFAPLNLGGPKQDRGNLDSFRRKDGSQSKRKPMQPSKPIEKPLTHVDKDTVNKVVDLKDKYQRMKDRTKEKEKELALLDMKIDALAERIKDVDGNNKEFKDQLFEEKKKNHVLRKKLEINEQEKLDLEQQLETGIKPTRKNRKGKGIHNVDYEDHQQMLEEKLRKEREEMRRQLFVGIDFLGGDQLRVSQKTDKTWYQNLKDKFYKF